MKNRNRSSLTINAVAQAAAQGAASALLPGRRLPAVAALAGLVLRLFRRSERSADTPPRAGGAKTKAPRPAHAADARHSRAGDRFARNGAGLPALKGGLSHG